MRNILHSDMNNFYASVECMLNPSLKGKPVAVCGSVEERHGIVLAKNYPAKAYGVQTGEAVWQAQQKCPGLIIASPHFDEYIKYSKLAREVYSRYTNQVEPYGMDECWLDISEYNGRNPEAVAYEIKETMKEELGLTVSVGVSFNKIFAKLGSDMKKPDAVTVIPNESFKKKIWHLPASDLLFVGRATMRTLDRFCIRTIGDLANTAPEFLKLYLGVHGLKLWQYANGLDNSPVMYEDYRPVVKSVGHGTTTKSDLASNEEVWITILELSQDIGHRLKKLGMNCMGISICIRNEDLMHKDRQQKLNFATQSPFVIAKLAYDLFLQKYVWNKNIRCPICGKAFRRLTNNGKNYWISSVVEKSSCICKNQRLRESGVFDAFSILTYKLKENREVLIDNLIAQLERIQQRFGGTDDRIGDIDKEIAQLCAQSHLLAKLNNNGVLSSAEYAEQAAEIENKIKTLRTERRKKLSENQDDEMLDELKTLRQILDEYKPHAEFDEALFEIIVKRIEVVNNSQLCFKLLGDIELTETINRKARCKQREAQDNPVWV